MLFLVQLPKGYGGHAYSTSAPILLESILYVAANTVVQLHLILTLESALAPETKEMLSREEN